MVNYIRLKTEISLDVKKITRHEITVNLYI